MVILGFCIIGGLFGAELGDSSLSRGLSCVVLTFFIVYALVCYLVHYVTLKAILLLGQF